MNVYVKLEGGLGNNLFRIATAHAYCLKNNKKLLCDVSDKQSSHGRFSDFYENIFRKLNLVDNTPNIIEYKHDGFEFSDIPNIPHDLKLNGLFQNEKYFVNYRDEILNLFEIDDDSLNFINDNYGNLLNEDTCSLHVRRGDYLFVSNILPVLDVDYYKKSVDEMGNDKLYVICSNDINWCKHNLGFIKNKIFVTKQPHIDLYLMSMCKNNIIGNSSFSWWSAWLNKNDNKKVIGPEIWFGPGINEWLLNNFNTRTLVNEIIPLTWQKI